MKKIGIALLIVGLILIAGIVIVTKTSVVTAHFKPQIEKQLSAALHSDVTFSHWRIGLNGKIYLYKVVIRDDTGKQLTVGRITAKVNLFALIKKKIILTYISLNKPDINIYYSAGKFYADGYNFFASQGTNAGIPLILINGGQVRIHLNKNLFIDYTPRRNRIENEGDLKLAGPGIFSVNKTPVLAAEISIQPTNEIYKVAGHFIGDYDASLIKADINKEERHCYIYTKNLKTKMFDKLDMQFNLENDTFVLKRFYVKKNKSELEATAFHNSAGDSFSLRTNKFQLNDFFKNLIAEFNLDIRGDIRRDTAAAARIEFFSNSTVSKIDIKGNKFKRVRIVGGRQGNRNIVKLYSSNGKISGTITSDINDSSTLFARLIMKRLRLKYRAAGIESYLKIVFKKSVFNTTLKVNKIKIANKSAWTNAKANVVYSIGEGGRARLFLNSRNVGVINLSDTQFLSGDIGIMRYALGGIIRINKLSAHIQGPVYKPSIDFLFAGKIWNEINTDFSYESGKKAPKWSVFLNYKKINAGLSYSADTNFAKIENMTLNIPQKVNMTAAAVIYPEQQIAVQVSKLSINDGAGREYNISAPFENGAYVFKNISFSAADSNVLKIDKLSLSPDLNKVRLQIQYDTVALTFARNFNKISLNAGNLFSIGSGELSADYDAFRKTGRIHVPGVAAVRIKGDSAAINIQNLYDVKGKINLSLEDKGIAYNGILGYSGISTKISGRNQNYLVGIFNGKNKVGELQGRITSDSLPFSGKIDNMRYKKYTISADNAGWYKNGVIALSSRNLVINNQNAGDYNVEFSLKNKKMNIASADTTFLLSFDYLKRNIPSITVRKYDLSRLSGLFGRELHGFATGNVSRDLISMSVPDFSFSDKKKRYVIETDYESGVINKLFISGSDGGLIQLKSPLALMSNDSSQLYMSHYKIFGNVYNLMCPITTFDDGTAQFQVMDLDKQRSLYQGSWSLGSVRGFEMQSLDKKLTLTAKYDKKLSFELNAKALPVETELLKLIATINFTYKNGIGSGKLLLKDVAVNNMDSLKFNSIKSDMSVANGIYSFDNLTFSSPNFNKAGGYISVNSNINNKISGRVFTKKILLSTLRNLGDIRGTGDINFYFVGTLQSPQIEYYIKSADFAYSDFEPDEINAFGHIEKNDFLLDKLSVKYKEEIINMTGRFDLSKKIYNSSLTSSSFALSNFLRFFGINLDVKGSVFTSNLHLRGAGDNFKIDGQLFSQYLKYKGQTADNIRTDIDMDSKSIRLNNGSFYSQQGYIRVHKAGFDYKTHKFMADFSLDNVAAADKIIVSGDFSADGSLKKNTLYSKLRAGDVYVNNMHINKIAVNTILDSSVLTVVPVYSTDGKVVTGFGKFSLDEYKPLAGDLELKLSKYELLSLKYDTGNWTFSGKDVLLERLVKLLNIRDDISGRLDFNILSSAAGRRTINFDVVNGAVSKKSFFRISGKGIKMDKDMVSIKNIVLNIKNDEINVSGAVGLHGNNSALMIKSSGIDLDFLRYFDFGKNFTGHAAFDIMMTGSYENQIYNGNASFEMAHIAVNENNILPSANLKINAKNSSFEVNGSVKSGKNGEGIIAGKFSFSGKEISNLNIKLTAQGDNGFYLDVPGAFTGQPKFDLTLLRLNRNNFVEGTVWLYNTQVEYPFAVIEEPHNIFTDFLDSLLFNLKLKADKGTVYRRENITATLDGGLNVSRKQGDVYDAFGTITSRNGHITLLGHDLSISSGELIVSGGDEQPFLKINAATDINDYRINIGVTGALDKLSIQSLSSDPALAEQDIYSLFATGQTQQEWSKEAFSKKLQQGFNALLKINLSNKLVNPIEKSIKHLTGVDFVSINPRLNALPANVFSSTGKFRTVASPYELFQGSSLSLGKFINKNIYLRYQGILGADELNKFSLKNYLELEYFISPNEVIHYQWQPADNGQREFKVKYERRIYFR